ncbi:MAG: hypothetical protein GY816_18070, partial [Cytophagales bacterium]|nr:hypothetical protein [Cytophagales bacterium]
MIAYDPNFTPTTNQLTAINGVRVSNIVRQFLPCPNIGDTNQMAQESQYFELEPQITEKLNMIRSENSEECQKQTEEKQNTQVKAQDPSITAKDFVWDLTKKERPRQLSLDTSGTTGTNPTWDRTKLVALHKKGRIVCYKCQKDTHLTSSCNKGINKPSGAEQLNWRAPDFIYKKTTTDTVGKARAKDTRPVEQVSSRYRSLTLPPIEEWDRKLLPKQLQDKLSEAELKPGTSNRIEENSQGNTPES